MLHLNMKMEAAATHKNVRGRHGTPVAIMAAVGAGPIIFAVALSSVLLHVHSERLLEGKHLRILPREVRSRVCQLKYQISDFVDKALVRRGMMR